MAETLYASFADPAFAERAAGALLDHGCAAEDISVVSREPVTGFGGEDRVTHSATLAEREAATETTTYADRELDEDVDPKSRDDMEAAAKTGISTTTPADAAAGAAKGAAVGLGVGALAALASLLIPGFGLVTGGGALATAIAGAAGTTAAGAVAGGVHGYLKDQGVAEEAAAAYEQTYQSGGAIVAVTIRPDKCDESRAREILAKYGASQVNVY